MTTFLNFLVVLICHFLQLILLRTAILSFFYLRRLHFFLANLQACLIRRFDLILWGLKLLWSIFRFVKEGSLAFINHFIKGSPLTAHGPQIELLRIYTRIAFLKRLSLIKGSSLEIFIILRFMLLEILILSIVVIK